jgi:hypothetical protein
MDLEESISSWDGTTMNAFLQMYNVFLPLRNLYTATLNVKFLPVKTAFFVSLRDKNSRADYNRR